jgi:peptide/nickel transport system ATP-binding protein
MALLEAVNLTVTYGTTEGPLRAVDGVSFKVEEHDVFGVAGESGSGKSTLMKMLLRLLPPTAKVSADRLAYRGRDLTAMNDSDFRRQILWKEISLVPQTAQNALNPVYRVGDQIMEAILTHSSMSRRAANERVAELFEIVGLENRLAASYPHQFSGGMRQRAMIAMSLALDPGLIIMDEPTTGLDVLTQERILRNLRQMHAKMRSAVILVTHDIAVMAELCNQVGIMYAGRLVERGPVQAIFEAPFHPYMLGLKNAFPDIRDMDRELISIPGSPPHLVHAVQGCGFAERCPFVLPACRNAMPPLREVGPGHHAACIRTGEAARIRALAKEKKTWRSSR